MDTITLKLSCKDKKGLIAAITSFIFQNGGNIVNLDQHTDPDKAMFFMRLEWDENGFNISNNNIQQEIQNFFEINKIKGQWQLFYSKVKPKMAIFVSKYDHCLYDLLLRYKSGELRCEIPLIISNHNDLESVAKYFNIDFFWTPVSPEHKTDSEKKQLNLLKEYKVDFIVLARYMQILTAGLINEYPDKIINIHHSFLPAFKGAKPYHQAYERGVKIIGATSHFVTEKLDQGPIIYQDVIGISHKDDINSLVTKGRNIEQRVLAEAVKLFIRNRIFVCANKTIIL